ncbi:uncharacterized protein [Euwallacea fornicatus]|uniref:uncharacterized protein n=1 Tax=Euwallacea fornicatus TaxID=995702 RepID=UPI00338DD814
MSLPFVLICTVALATLALSASVSQAKTATDTAVETFDSALVRSLPEQLPMTIQLPKEETSLPFYQGQPPPYLSASQILPNYYQVPVPSEFLIAPTEGSWNPYNDPTLYYELPASITKEVLPTNQFPKKFNKDIHLKGKPISTVPKQEITLEPIDESQYIQKNKELYKTMQQLNKKENQRNVEKKKVPNYNHNLKMQVKQASEALLTNTKSRQTKPKSSTSRKNFPKPTTLRSIQNQRPHIGTHVSRNIDSTAEQTVDTNYEHDTNKYTKGLSPQITDSLGVQSKQGSRGNGNDRVLFHMVGQDGPMSYKWGYDTGRGPNRQFRFEERDREGVVKGQYGYYDTKGKFRMMNYFAHPETGFRMEPAPESDIDESSED